jgi:acetylornithine deacetylase/succinyl-diaminopimelate desuccinylase-like protein
METVRTDRYVSEKWDDDIVPQLVDYIRIPNKSPMFDADWQKHGYMDDAVKLMEAWARAQNLPGTTIEVVRLPGRTPLIYIEVEGEGDDCVLLYGHLDKQPEMTGWADDLGPCEESGSYDLPHYVDHLAARIGMPSLVVCLDSGCGNYDQLWCTTSLRGMAGGNLKISVLEEGVHSGDASGIVPSSFRLLRQILSRLEDETTGRIRVEDLHVEIPAERITQAKRAAEVLGTAVYDKFPFLPGMTPMADDLAELVLNRTWRPALSITGVDGMPPLSSAGNVLRPHTAVKVSLRLPPTLDGDLAGKRLQNLLLDSPPNGARVEFALEKSSTGWNAPAMSSWLEHAIDHASRDFFGQPAMYMGEGGTIPFMGMLGEKFPGAQFMITGVLGPHSNAHGPNEFLHIPTGKRVTAAVARVVAEHYQASTKGLTQGVAAAAGEGRFGDHGCC